MGLINCTTEKYQHCKECKWYQIDDMESAFYGEYKYTCTKPDTKECIHFKEIGENNNVY